MRAFHDIRTEMRETCRSLTGPFEMGGLGTVARVSRDASEDEHDLTDHIEPWMAAAFEGLIHAGETDDPFALVPCFMNGKPAAVIAAIRTFGRKVHVTPLFLACQPWMTFGSEPGESGGAEGGGPDRAAATDPPAPR